MSNGDTVHVERTHYLEMNLGQSRVVRVIGRHVMALGLFTIQWIHFFRELQIDLRGLS